MVDKNTRIITPFKISVDSRIDKYYLNKAKQ